MAAEDAQYASKVDRILMKVRNGDIADETISEDLRLVLINGLKQDERERQVEKVRGAVNKKGKGRA